MAKESVVKIINQFDKFPTDFSVEEMLQNEIQRIHNQCLRDNQNRLLTERTDIPKEFNIMKDELDEFRINNSVSGKFDYKTKYSTNKQNQYINKKGNKLSDTIMRLNNDLVQVSSEYKNDMYKYSQEIDNLKRRINDIQKEQFGGYIEEDKLDQREYIVRCPKTIRNEFFTMANSKAEKTKYVNDCLNQDTKGLNLKLYSTANHRADPYKHIKTDVSISDIKNKETKDDTTSGLAINKSYNRVMCHSRQKSAGLFRTRGDASNRKNGNGKTAMKVTKNFELVT